MPLSISYKTYFYAATTYKFNVLDLIVVWTVTVFYETTLIKLMLIFLISLYALLLSDITGPADNFNMSYVYFVPVECTYVFCMALEKKLLLCARFT